MKNCPSSQFLLAGNKQPPRGQLGGIFCQTRQKSLMDSMSRAKRGSFQQAKEKRSLHFMVPFQCTLYQSASYSFAGLRSSPSTKKTTTFILCAAVLWIYEPPLDVSSYISLFIFASEVLKLLRTVGRSKNLGASIQ